MKPGSKEKHIPSRKILLALVTFCLVSIVASVAVVVTARLENTRSKSQVLCSFDSKNNVIDRFFDDGSIVVGLSSNSVQYYDATGTLIWEVQTGGSVKSVAVSQSEGLIFAACEDSTLLALDREGGLQNETKLRGRAMDMYLSEEAGQLAVTHGIGVTSQKFFVSLYEFNLERLFSTQTYMDTYACIVARDGSGVYYGTKDSNIGKLEPDGAPGWRITVKFPVRDMAMADNSGHIVAVDNKGYVYWISRDGKIAWDVQLPSGGSSSLLYDEQNEVIVVGGTDGSLIAIGHDGAILDSSIVGVGSVSGIAIAGESYIGICGQDLFEVGRFSNTQSVKIDWFFVGSVILVASVILFIVFVLIYAYTTVKRARETMKEMHRMRIAYIMLLPTFILLGLFTYYPIVRGFVGAFTNWSPFRETAFIGLENFKTMLSDVYLHVGIKNMVYLTVSGILKNLTSPMLAALLIYHLTGNRIKYAYRTGFVLTTIVPGVALALMWKMMYDPNIGLINSMLQKLGMSDFAKVWLGDESIAIWSVIFIGFPWISVFSFLVYYGAFNNISLEIYDSAKVDGANAIQRFFRIEIPQILPQIKMLLLLSLIGGMQDYNNILLLTRGGPGRSTYVPALQIFFNVSSFGEYGYASALGLVLFAFILMFSLIIQRIPASND